MFWGVLTSKHYFFIIETPQKPYLTRKHAFWAINGRDRSSGVTCRRGQEHKKGWNTKSNGKCLPYADLLSVVPQQPNFACGVVSQISFLISSFIKIGWKMWELWGVEISAFPLTWLIAYTTACCYRTSRDVLTYLFCHFICLFICFVVSLFIYWIYLCILIYLISCISYCHFFVNASINNVQVFSDFAIRREMNSLDCVCCHSSCTWTGKFKDFGVRIFFTFCCTGAAFCHFRLLRHFA